MKTFRPPFHVDFHSERGEVTINVTDADGKDVWYATTETVNELIEDGFLSTKGFAMGRNLRPDVLERSVLDYLNSVGIIDNRFIGGPSRDVSRSAWGIQGGHASPPQKGTHDYYADLFEKSGMKTRHDNPRYPDFNENTFVPGEAFISVHPSHLVMRGQKVREWNAQLIKAGKILAAAKGKTEEQARAALKEQISKNTRAERKEENRLRDREEVGAMYLRQSMRENNPIERLYDLYVINEKTGRKTKLTDTPDTHARIMTLKSKFNPHKDVRFFVEEYKSNPGDVHIDIHSHNTRGSGGVHAKNPMFSGEGHEEGIPRFGRFYDRNGRVAVFGERDNYRIEYPFMDGPVKAYWFEKVNGRPQGAFAIRHNTPEAVRLLVKETEAYDSSTPFYEPRVRRDNPTAADVAGWVDHYKGSMEKRIDGVPEKSHYVIAIQTTDNQSAFLRVGKGSKFDTDPAKARVYRNSDKANEAATKVMNWLKKKYPAKAKKIKSIGVQPKK